MRFYVSPEAIFQERNIIEIKDKKEIHHIRDVMRLEKGAEVDIFDGGGREYSGYIKDIKRDLVVINIKEVKNFKDNPLYKITLFQAIPKRGKMDSIIEKAVELGVDHIVPMITDRTVGFSNRQSPGAKIERWRRVCKAAGKQCGRAKLPLISDIADFESSIEEAKNMDLVIFAALDKMAIPLKFILKDSAPKNIAVFVGPEGDFSDREITSAKQKSYAISSLGSLVLRVETAAVYILSCLNYQYGI